MIEIGFLILIFILSILFIGYSLYKNYSMVYKRLKAKNKFVRRLQAFGLSIVFVFIDGM